MEVTRVYLDHQASTPMSCRALDEMLPAFSECYANPHSDDHAAGWEAAQRVEASRTQVADAIGADGEQIVFTSGATESNNLAMLGLVETRRHRSRVVVSAIEHKSILATARAIADRGYEVVTIPVDPLGQLDMAALRDAVDERTLLVSIGFVNNEIGAVQPMEAISQLCRGAGALLHSDAAQALSWDAVSVDGMGVDLLSLSAHKAGGPKGIGALYVGPAAADRLRSIIHGGGQELGLRPGTVPTPLCIGFGAACNSLPSTQQVAAWRAVTVSLLDRLRALFPDLQVNGALEPRHPGNLSIRLPGIDADVLAARLQPGVAVARGSACTSGLPEPSHVLRAIGLTAGEAGSCLRLSTSPATTEQEVAFVEAAFAAAIRGMARAPACR
ncbi:MAG: cysteine desulfurase family protein [Aurantimonas endophytica]|uniref:cysteine desulfurase family protein n=1 Tax=Aurantimonas endophytica TaxID=1522175 RepID=UPI003001F4B3